MVFTSSKRVLSMYRLPVEQAESGRMEPSLDI
jgi:hypothetical protein